MKMAPKITLKSGSRDLTTLTKAREPAPSDMTVTHCPIPWISACGRIVFTLAIESFGGLRRPLSHIGKT